MFIFAFISPHFNCTVFINDNGNGFGTMKTSEHRIDDTLVVSLEGTTDLWHGAALRRVLLDAVARARAVLVDLSGVTIADSSLAANLVEALDTARKAGVDFALTSVRPAVMRVFELARLDQVFEVHRDQPPVEQAPRR